MPNTITGNERIYVVDYNFTKRYINSWDLLHKITPAREEFVNDSSKLYVIANNENEAITTAYKVLKDKLNVEIISVEIQPWFFFEYYCDGEGGWGIEFDKDNIPHNHYIYGDKSGLNTLKTVADNYIVKSYALYNNREEFISELYDILQDKIDEVNENLYF